MDLKAGKIVANGQHEALPLEFAKDPNGDDAPGSMRGNYHSRALHPPAEGYSVSDSTIIIEGLRTAILAALPEETKNGLNDPASVRQCVEALAKIARLGQQASLRQDAQIDVVQAILDRFSARNEQL
jgi:hypothetical protein